MMEMVVMMMVMMEMMEMMMLIMSNDVRQCAQLDQLPRIVGDRRQIGPKSLWQSAAI